MTKRFYRKHKLMKKVAVILAAAPLFQLSQCATFSNQVFGNGLNALPSVYFQTLQSVAFLPIQILTGAVSLGGGGGSSGSGTTGGSGGGLAGAGGVGSFGTVGNFGGVGGF